MNPASSPSKPRGRRWLRWLVINLAVTAVLLAGLEGLAGLLLADTPDPSPPPPPRRHVAERKHTRYDELVGWVNIPGVVLTNMYGEGEHLSINNLGFRGTRTIDPDRPAGSRRKILSGNSFTFGYGVGDEDTWGVHLEHRFPDTEVLNQGLGGYGVDQAFLLYRREGDPLPHDLHIFAFITEDFRRMTRPRFMGYGKPVVVARNGRLSVENVPPPWPDANPEAPSAFELWARDLDLVRYVQIKATEYRRDQADHWARSAEETALLLFQELYAMHRKAGRMGVLVHLPVEKDYAEDDSDSWRAWFARHAPENGWVYLDLVEEMRKLPADDIPGMFIQHNLRAGARGHYTTEGNIWVADTLARHLTEIPEVARRLGHGDPP